MNFDDPKVGGATAMALTRTRGRLNDGTTIPYAFGIVNGEYRGQPIVNHSGSWASFATFVLHFPAQHFGVIVLANSGTINAGRAAYDLADIYLASELGPRAPPAPNAIATARPVAVAPAVLDRYAGLYRLGPGWYVRVRRDGGALKVQATREAEVAMSARSDTTFWIADYNAAMAFQSSAAGPTMLAYRTMRVPKLEESPPLTRAQLGELAGEYESAELRARYRIELTDSGLVMRHPRHGTIALSRLWRDEFGGSTWFTRSVEFRRDETGRVIGFSVYVDERSRDIRFTRVP
jgi:hypothetical protein